MSSSESRPVRPRTKNSSVSFPHVQSTSCSKRGTSPMPDGPLSAPVTITWEVTLGCNLHCDHCLSGSGPGHQLPTELDTSEAKQFIEELDELTQRDISTCVSTNGTQLDEATLDRIEAMDPLFLQVSMDGLRAENDAI